MPMVNAAARLAAFRHGCAGGARPLAEAGAQKRRQPRPHRIQLPHVAEVAEICQPQRRIGQRTYRPAQIDGTAARLERSAGHPETQ